MKKTNTWTLGGKTFQSRLLLGTAGYPSLACLQETIQSSGAQILTVSLRRQHPLTQGSDRFWEILKSFPVTFLPNTAGCRSAKEAVTTAHLAREIFGTSWIKLEVIGDDYTLSPNPFELVEASKILVREGFEVFPYMTEDLILADALIKSGCKILMPWGSPIGSGQGLRNPHGLRMLRNKFPQIPMIVDAGLGLPSHALQAMEMGLDGVLLNTAIAKAAQPPQMAQAFALAIESGRLASIAGPMLPRDYAVPSTPVVGTPFWHEEKRKEEKSF